MSKLLCLHLGVVSSSLVTGLRFGQYANRSVLRRCSSNMAARRNTKKHVSFGRFVRGSGGTTSVMDSLERDDKIRLFSSSCSSEGTEYVTLAQPAPGSPFHYAFPVHDLDLAKEFYSDVLGCVEGRSSEKWQDYSLHGHQIVAHWVGNDYRCQDYFNPVDGDEVPVPHTGLALTEDQFHELAERVRKANIKFIIEPHLRFKGMPGEQWTMFFKDPSGNNLEFKAMTNINNLFAKYNVVD